ncbi:hypothetical protein FQA39_LY10572 [Lamprigera yunnana]|nr:hypothetical protein FQA39_LY10572 [Lamprigera yunnana]
MMKNAEQILSNNEEFNNVNQNVTSEDKNELPVCVSSHHLDQELFDILEQNTEDGDSHVEQLSTRSNVDQEENGFLENTEWPGDYANATQQNQGLTSVEKVRKYIHKEDGDDSINDKDYQPNFSDVSLEEISEPEGAKLFWIFGTIMAKWKTIGDQTIEEDIEGCNGVLDFKPEDQ